MSEMKFDGCHYLHSDKESSSSRFMEACEDYGHEPDDKAVENACYSAYEVDIAGYWTPEGNFWATAVNGMLLKEPVKL